MKPSSPDLYCKVFVDTSVDAADLLRLIARCVGGMVDLYAVESPTCEIGVQGNDEFDESLTGGADGFLYYPFILDIEPRAGVPKQEYITTIGRLLEYLWSKDMKAVAAARFEDALPRRGGYNPEGADSTPTA